MTARTQLLDQIAAFLRATGMTERQFGIEAAGSHHFLKMLRSGRGITLTRIERAERFMDDRWGKARQGEQAQPQDVVGLKMAQNDSPGQAS